MKWTLYVKIGGTWRRVSDYEYELAQAQKIWKEVLLDALRTRGPERELRPVKERSDGAYPEPPRQDTGLDILHQSSREAAYRRRSTAHRVSVGRAVGARQVRLLSRVPHASLAGWKK